MDGFEDWEGLWIQRLYRICVIGHNIYQIVEELRQFDLAAMDNGRDGSVRS